MQESDAFAERKIDARGKNCFESGLLAEDRLVDLRFFFSGRWDWTQFLSSKVEEALSHD